VQTGSSARFPLGKGEVVSSILTSSMLKSLGLSETHSHLISELPRQLTRCAAAILPFQCLSRLPQPLWRMVPISTFDHLK
jgi:hypothetical protein